MDVYLPATLAPAGTYDLIRLGNDRDGGYLVDPRSVAGAARLVSFGMADDWSFEEAFHRTHPVPVDIYDHSVSGDWFFRQAFQHLLRWDRPGLIRDQVRTWLRFRRFFRGEVRHHRTRIGYDWPGWTKGLDAVLDELLGPARDARLFLKVDIETWEYRLLDQIVANAGLLEGLAIEFHDLDLLLPRLLDFVERLPLHLCHIHSNNAGGLAPDGTPLVLELTFSRHPPQDPARPSLPHPLDAQNAGHIARHTLRFRDA